MITIILTICFIFVSLNSIRCFKRFHSATRIRLASVNPTIGIKDYENIEVDIGKNFNVISTKLEKYIIPQDKGLY